MFLIFRFVLTTAVILFVSHFVTGFTVVSAWSAFFFAIVLGAINAVIRPVLVLLTIPITVLTLGLFLLFINAFTFYLASLLSFGVNVATFGAAFWGAFFVWFISLLLNRFLDDQVID
ncbi:MAG: hypothetical protein S4CHLAM102_16430 [Chlamydiia bacterium]|nr:hypothetical protein [Chlamydiia bacterium]